MKAVLALVLIVLALPLTVRASEIDTLVQQIKRTRNTSRGISDDEQKIAGKLQAIGASAIPSLLPLLRDPNQNVRDAAAYVLRDMPGLREEHLAPLIEAYHRDHGGWVGPAIASIGTPDAIDFLVEELVRARETENQTTWAIKLLGEKAIPPLLRVYQTNLGWDERLAQTMDHVFHELAAHAEPAVDPLRQIVNDEKASTARRIHAMRALGAIGLTAERATPDLQKMQASADPDLSAAAMGAILQMGGAASAPLLAESLVTAKEDSIRLLVLRDIASLHERGRAAGPTVVKYLSSANWEVRLCAVRTLGYIGYQESAGELIRLLGCVEDWRVVMSAAEALGRMEVKAALPALTKVSQDHWFPPVRSAAITALPAIRDRIHPKSRYPDDNFPLEFFDYWNAGLGMEILNDADANRIRFPIQAAKSEVPKAVLTKLEANGETRGIYCGLKVDGGYLVGRDSGEWGGDIVFIDDQGKSQMVLRENTQAVYQTPNGILATTGLDHLGMNGGVLYRLEKNAAGQWQGHPWRQLPGAPFFSRLLKDGRLLVNCDGGIVVVSPNGDMQLLTRKEVLKP
ncbi:PBS lyase HEAT domain protein repeat-containing protein [Chthoniobacter flavus Ellin428]|uniref:PBS lyase HEAT domain protein repeat-containing protein n=1 Tax=Chthoniobacter flavus Ellin428 TaxID=497964 RepID=B4DBI8_9BACT|nr:HEAT repeat domain-containing protein [Chthoniobacter flavus]EDY16175.1 PBS lyase HEAT domain protein repeat-containing protein [Chthoniobacter flavus Ellin428]TCO87176.1 HEAT repeat protein [Chthoniobacter flavus]